jgi:hypothetical protein
MLHFLVVCVSFGSPRGLISLKNGYLWINFIEKLLQVTHKEN